MGSAEPNSTPPKLSFRSLPAQRWPDQPGMATPPLRHPGAVPFLWEDAPGKPKPRKDLLGVFGPGPYRVTDLPVPPRMTLRRQDSRTTVLDGLLGACYSFSYTQHRSRPPEQSTRKKLGAWFWRRKGRRSGEKDSPALPLPPPPSSSPPSTSSSSGGHKDEEGGKEGGRATITRLTRSSSLRSVPSLHATSHLWR